MAWAGLAAVALTTSVTAAVGLLLGARFAELLGVPRLAGLWWLVCLAVLVMGCYLVASEWMVRERSYGALGRRNLLQGVGQVGTQVGLGLAGVRPLGLLLGFVTRQAACHWRADGPHTGSCASRRQVSPRSARPSGATGASPCSPRPRRC